MASQKSFGGRTTTVSLSGTIREIRPWTFTARRRAKIPKSRRPTRNRGWREKAVVTKRNWLFAANVIIENHNGLVVDTKLAKCSGTAEREAAIEMVQRVEGRARITVAADKGYDTREFVSQMRAMNATPHVAANYTRLGGSAIDGRTARHAGCWISQQKRKRIEEVFGWLKTVAILRKTRHRGLLRVGWLFTFSAAAYNLVRMRNLLSPAVRPA